MLIEMDKLFLPHLWLVQTTNSLRMQARGFLDLGSWVFLSKILWFPVAFKLQSLVASPMGTCKFLWNFDIIVECMPAKRTYC